MIKHKRELAKQLKFIEKQIQDDLRKELESKYVDSDSFFSKFKTIYFTDDNRGIILGTLLKKTDIKNKTLKKDLLMFCSRLLIEDISERIPSLRLNWCYAAMCMLTDMMNLLEFDDLANEVETLAENMRYKLPEDIEDMFDGITKKFYRLVPEQDIKIFPIQF